MPHTLPLRSNGKQIWVNPPMNCQELLIEQVARLKAVNPNQKVWIYRNLVKVWLSVGNECHQCWHLGCMSVCVCHGVSVRMCVSMLYVRPCPGTPQ